MRWRDRVRDLEVELDRRTVTWMAVLAGTLGLAVGAVGTCGGEAVADERVPSVAPAVVTSPESVIELRFTEHDQLSGRGLDARVQGRVAVLTGTVKTEADRALAGRLALVGGVDRVDNQLELEPPPRPLTRQARANPPLTRDERERRKRPGAEAAPAPVSEAEETPPAPAASAGVRPAALKVAAVQAAAPRPAAVAPILAPAVTGAMAVPAGPATGLAANAPAIASPPTSPSPAQILGEASPPPSPAATSAVPATDGQ